MQSIPISWVASFFLFTTTLHAETRSLTSLVPADSLVVYTAKPYTILAPTSSQANATTQPSAPVSSIANIINLLNLSGLIPDEGQVFADVAAAMPLLGLFEHAIALLDVSSRLVDTSDPRDPDDVSTSLRLNRMQLAVIFHTQGCQRIVLEQLNRVIGRYTNLEVGKLTAHEAAGFTYQRLMDSRLIGWAVWEWGRLDDFFVVSFGEGAFEAVAKTYAGKSPSLAGDSWFRRATARTKGESAIAQWFISFTKLRESLGSVSEDRVALVTAALQAEKVSHDLWTIGREGRAMTWFRCFRRGGEDIVCRYSDPARYNDDQRRIIPDRASNFAIIQLPTRWLVDNIPMAWLAAQSRSNADKWRRVWDRLEQETGVDIDGSLVSNLEQDVVIFDYPPHPLRIPFAITVAIEIKNRKTVEQAVNTLLEAWGRYLDERAERTDSDLFRVKVKRAEDRIWYLQAGILGPALKVTDRYIVVSWSPEALREALNTIESPERLPTSP